MFGHHNPEGGITKRFQRTGISVPVIDNLPQDAVVARQLSPSVIWLVMSEQTQRARAIQESIRQVLLRNWDPIGVNNVPEAQDEYDSYVGGVYRRLASGCSEDEIVEHLWRIEAHTMGLLPTDRESLRPVATKLMNLDISL